MSFINDIMAKFALTEPHTRIYRPNNEKNSARRQHDELNISRHQPTTNDTTEEKENILPFDEKAFRLKQNQTE